MAKFGWIHLFRMLAVWFFLACIFSQGVSAQVLYGSIVGTVEDPTGAVIPGATLSLTHVATGNVREITTDNQGRYTAVNMPAGSYTVVATAPGFRTLTRTGVEVTINSVTRANLRLEVGQISEQVTVSGTLATLQTDRSDTRTEINSRAVVELPLSNYRNYQSLINLVPGATPAAEQNSMGASPQRALTTNVNGTNRNNNNTRVDGSINVYIWLPHHSLYVPPVESIETVNISTSSFDAEQGMAGGAAVTVATKSGTNDLHGVGFWYHDNQHLYARPFFYKQSEVKPRLNKSITNIPGGTISGPIIKNKLFYFFSFERNWLRQNTFSNTVSVPTADIRTGDFSAYTGLGLIYDPLTGDANGNGRTPFPNNKIPSNRLSPIWQQIQALCPLPNQKAADSWGLTNNYFASAATGMTRDNYDVKINYNVNQKLMIWGKYSDMVANVFGDGALGTLVGPALGQNGEADVRIKIPTFGFSLTQSSTFLVDAIFGHTRFENVAIGPDYGKNWGSEVWKIPGTNGGNMFAGDIRYSGMPLISNGFSSWGNNASSNPNFYHDRSYTFTNNYTKLYGAHELRWGIDIVHHAMNHWQPETANPRGALSAGGQATVLNGQVIRSIHTYAAGLLDILGSANKSVQFIQFTTREWQEGFYFRDRWQVNRKLTVNLGARWEYYPLMSRDGRGLERWDPATNIVTMGGVGNIPKNNGMTTSKKLIAPRVGIAYRWKDNTVIRAGFGITFNPMVLSRPLKGIYPATITSSWVAPTTYGYYGTFSKGIPDVATPDITSGMLTLPATVDMGPRSPIAGQIKRGYIQSWNFTVEHKLPADMLISVGYVGNQTVRQFVDHNINAATYLGGGNSSRPLAATQGRLINAYMFDGWANGNYHALQVGINKNLSKGLFLKGAYTWSKTINMCDEDGWASLPFTDVPGTLDKNRSVSGYDRPHMFVMSWVYDLPFGKGQAFAKSGFASTLLSGWRLNGMYSAYSGTPFTVTASTASLNTPGTYFQTADLIGSITKIGDVGPGTQFYAVEAFRDPNFQRPSGTYRFGTMGRNAMRGPGFQRADLALFRDFRLTERMVLQFKAEAFNFTNTPRFGNPSSNVSSMTVNPTTGAITNVGGFMAITSASDERKFRFGLRLSF